MDLANDDKQAQSFFIDGLSLDRYAEWAAKEGGRVHFDSEGRPAGRKGLGEATIREDKAILRNFGGWAFGRSKNVNYELDLGRADHFRDLADEWVPVIRSRVSALTVERYLVAIRRYSRSIGLPDTPLRRKAPYYRRQRGPGRVITRDQLGQWLDLVCEDSDPVTYLVSWLLLSGVPVGSLTALRYGSDVRKARGAIYLSPATGVNGEIPGELQRLLDHGYRRGYPILGSPEDQSVPLLDYLVRRRWEKHRQESQTVQPTMRDLLAFGRFVESVDLVDGRLEVRVPFQEPGVS